MRIWAFILAESLVSCSVKLKHKTLAQLASLTCLKCGGRNNEMMNWRCELTRLLVDEVQSFIVVHLHKETVTDRHKDSGRVLADRQRHTTISRIKQILEKNVEDSTCFVVVTCSYLPSKRPKSQATNQKQRDLHFSLDVEVTAEIHICLQLQRVRILQEDTLMRTLTSTPSHLHV